MLKNKDFLFEIINGADLYVFVIDEYNRIVETNNNVYKSLGYKYFDLVEKSFSFLIIPEDKEYTNEIIKKMFEKEIKEEQEFFLQTKEKETKLISCRYSIYIKSNTPSPPDPAYTFYDDKYLVLIGKDITNERLSEQTKKIEQMKFDSLFHNPGVAQTIIDLDNKFIEINETFCDLIGYNKEEVLKLTQKDITYTDDLNLIDYVKKELLNENKKYVQIEKRFKKHNGFFFWALITTTLHKTENNEPLYFIQTIQDITEKKFLEEYSKENEKKYKLLFYRSFNAIAYKKLIYDKKNKVIDYIILDANESFEKLTGLKRQEIINRPMKVKAKDHFHVTKKENMKRLKHYEKIIKDGQDIHYNSEHSRTTNKPMDVYYYILDKKESIFAVVFGDTNNNIMTI